MATTKDKLIIVGFIAITILSIAFSISSESESTIQNFSFDSAYIFSHTNETIHLISANTWQNITFGQEVADLKKNIEHTHSDKENDTFIIMKSGIYNIDYDIDVIDISPSSTDIDIAARVIFDNGSEIPGSVFETDITKKAIENELSHNFLAELNSGDKLIIQFTANDPDVVISTHGTFGDHPESATVLIEKISEIN